MAIATSLAIAGAAAAASIGGAAIASGASKKASNTAAKAATDTAAQNNALQREIYGQNAARLDPYTQRGNQAGAAINALAGLGGDQQGQEDAFARFRDSTGYQFRLNEGANALQQQYAARGLLQSGAAQKDLLRYGQDSATGAFGQYLNALMGQQQTGFGAASGLAGVGQNFANATSANNNSAASAVGNAALAQGYNTSNAIGQGVQGFNQLLGSSFGGGGFGGGGGFTPSPQIGAYNRGWLNSQLPVLPGGYSLPSGNF